MEYKELIDYGKGIFGFHPDTKIESMEQLLYEGRKSTPRGEYYAHAVALIGEGMARFIDRQQAT